MYDASSRKDIRAAEKAADRLANDRIQFLRAALDTREGRAWFYHFLADCHCFRGDVAFDSPRDYFALGERNIGLKVFSEIHQYCPDQYILMQREENVRLASLSTATERSRRPNNGWNTQGSSEPAIISTEFDPFAEPDSGDES